MMVTDTSGSMEATDVAPTRLAAAQAAARALTKKLPEQFNLGLVDVQQRGRSRSWRRRPTATRSTPRSTALKVQGATAMGDGLQLGLNATRTPVTGRRRAAAAAAGARSCCSPTARATRGARPARRRRAGQEAEDPDLHGRARHPDRRAAQAERRSRRRCRPTRRRCATSPRTTGGRFFTAPTPRELEAVYANLGTRLATRRRSRRSPSAFAGGALALLLAGAGARRCCGRGGCREPARAHRPAARRSARRERPGPGPVPAAVLRSLDLAVMRRIECLVPGEHLTPQVGARHRARADPPLPAGRRRAPHRLERDRADAASRTCACTSASAR